MFGVQDLFTHINVASLLIDEGYTPDEGVSYETATEYLKTQEVGCIPFNNQAEFEEFFKLCDDVSAYYHDKYIARVIEN